MEKKDITREKRLKILGRLFVNFAAVFALYRLILVLAERYSVWIYYIGMSAYIAGAAILFCLFYARNGYTFSGAATPAELLPAEWSDVEKVDFLREEALKKARAKKLVYLIFPVTITIFVSYIELFFVDFLKTIFH